MSVEKCTPGLYTNRLKHFHFTTSEGLKSTQGDGKKREEHEKEYKSVRNMNTTDTYLNFLSINLEKQKRQTLKNKANG